MKFIIELETDDDGARTKSEWALWLLKCICAFLKPDGVRSLSVGPVEPEEGSRLQ